MATTFNKIFCIGMNKTGTSSLHQAFLRLGLKSIHHGPPGWSDLREHLEQAEAIRERMKACLREGKDMLSGLQEYQAFSDIGPIIHHFETLDRQHPNSRFIYTQRNTDAWIESRKKHILRNRRNIERGVYSTTFVDVEAEKWKRSKQSHFERVLDYFAARPGDLLIMDITRGEGYEKLCPFLGLPVPDEDFPRKNVASEFGGPERPR